VVTWTVTTDHGSTVHDDVILATHADQSLALLADADAQERRILGAFAFHANHAVLHTDASMMPRRRRAWGSWSYECASHVGREEAGACVHYWLNALQPVPFSTPLFVSINPVREPDPARVIDRFSFTHPVFDQAAIDAQPDVARLQGVRRTWFCGAWMGYGFHEDGLKAGQAVALAIARRDALSLHALPRPAAAAARAA
jgi:predicted NAD/FAD-binding protein